MAKFFGCSFLIALILAWPTFGISIIVWIVAFYFSARRERQLYELRDNRYNVGPSERGPDIIVIEKGLEGTLTELSAISSDMAANVFEDLDVTYHGEPIDRDIASRYFYNAIDYGLENIPSLTSHMMNIANAARQRNVTKKDQEASLRSMLCWCVENAARDNRDNFYLVDIGRASRNGAIADRRMLG